MDETVWILCWLLSWLRHHFKILLTKQDKLNQINPNATNCSYSLQGTLSCSLDLLSPPSKDPDNVHCSAIKPSFAHLFFCNRTLRWFPRLVLCGQTTVPEEIKKKPTPSLFFLNPTNYNLKYTSTPPHISHFSRGIKCISVHF